MWKEAKLWWSCEPSFGVIYQANQNIAFQTLLPPLTLNHVHNSYLYNPFCTYYSSFRTFNILNQQIFKSTRLNNASIVNMLFPSTSVAWAIVSLGLINNADAFWRLQCFGRLGTAMMDPIVSPGAVSSHEHTVKGGSGTYSSFRASHSLVFAKYVAGHCV